MISYFTDIHTKERGIMIRNVHYRKTLLKRHFLLIIKNQSVAACCSQ